MSLRRGCQVVADMHTDRDRLNLIYYLASPANILYSTCLHYTLIACQINSVFLYHYTQQLDRQTTLLVVYRINVRRSFVQTGLLQRSADSRLCMLSTEFTTLRRIFLNHCHSVCVFTRHICTNPPYTNQPFNFIF